VGENSTTEPLVPLSENGITHNVYPEIAEFFAMRKKADLDLRLTDLRNARDFHEKEYTLQIEAIERGDTTYDAYSATSEARVVQRTASRAAQTAHSDTNTAAWRLLTESSHKEVKWIAENCRSYETECLTILRYLPSTLEELWSVAKDHHGMCEVFDQFAEQAEAAGLFSKDGSKTPEVIKYRTDISRRLRRDYGSATTRSVLNYLEEYARLNLAAAQAHWQKLDEAHAENVHRNRSEGARKAAETRRMNAQELANKVASTPGADVADVVSVPEAEDIREALKEEVNA